MIRRGVVERRTAAVVGVALLGLGVVGCAGSPAVPSPSPGADPVSAAAAGDGHRVAEDATADADEPARRAGGASSRAGERGALPRVLAGDPVERAPLDLGLHSTTDPASPWVIVNKPRPLVPQDYVPQGLVDVQGYLVSPLAAPDLVALLAAAAAEGVRLPIASAYRSAEYQAGVHAELVASHGQEAADRLSARPGHSEHQTGLAVDLRSATQPECDFEDCFAGTAEGVWLAAHAAEFGFILRYPPTAVDVTGYAPEGWHLRYVGRELAAEMARRGVATLEELFGVPGGAVYP